MRSIGSRRILLRGGLIYPAEAKTTVSKDVLRILLWLGVLAGSALLFVAVARLAPGSDWGALIGLAPALALSFLIMSIFAAGAKAAVVDQGGDSIHRLSWGAILFLGAVSAAAAAFILFVLKHAEPFWFWSLSVPGIAICAFFLAGPRFSLYLPARME